MWNKIDLTMTITFFTILGLRINNNFLPGSETPTDSLYIFKSILNALMLISIYTKLLFFLRMYEQYGKMIQLLWQCILDLRPFLLFFVTLIILVSLVLIVNQVTYDSQDYPYLPNFWIVFLQTYRNSIGDLSPPDYSYWTDDKKISSGEKIIITLIWLVWLLN